MHAHSFKSEMRMDVSVENAFLSMYTDLNCVEAAQKVFGEMSPDVDVILYNTLILALARDNLRGEANYFKSCKQLKSNRTPIQRYLF